MNQKIYVISCAVLARDIKETARDLGLRIETKFLEAGLHENPHKLQTKLQAAIDAVSAKKDAARIIVGYGVCGKGTIGVKSRNVPLAIPKVHDCIALFLGGDQAYKEEFKRCPGTYYLSAGWCEEKAEPVSQRRQRAYFGAERLEFEEIKQAHGEAAANKTFEFLNSWQKNYKRAAFIETRSGQAPKYEKMAKDMAVEYGWEFQRIQGDQSMIRQMLTADASTPELLVVPPNHVIAFDAITSTLSASPVWQSRALGLEPETVVVEDDASKTPGDFQVRIGLGIDAGGTYTDAVIYSLEDQDTLCKAKSLTTKWDFTIGIGKALEKLDPGRLDRVELVALSTTLATNAIVENEGQTVGMVLMPPFGSADNITYTPKAVIAGELDITGQEKSGIDPDQVRKTADRMIRNHGVTAFAVSGYAGSINPAHELAVKEILEDHTGMFTSCGHELSDALNFQTRAVTAMLNARIIPRLKGLLADLEAVLDRFGIQAPIVVVKGDGTLMGSDMARQRPVETILSGPAASVAGARHLTGEKDALVVDMGGTTTDTAALTDNLVRLNESGSNVGGRRTHVRALEIRTAGLGGDSLITFEKGEFLIGPGRVAPIAWLGAHRKGATDALDYLKFNLNRFTTSGRKMQVLTATGSVREMDLSPLEAQVVALLKQRPYSIDELVAKTGVLTDTGLPLARLEENFIIQRCGLTFTDLLHIQGQFVKWDKDLAAIYCDMLAFLSGKDPDAMIKELMDTGIKRLSLELLKRQLDDETDPEGLESCPVCRALTANMLCGGTDQYHLRMELKRPVIGIGAPIGFFLPQAAKALGARAILPKDADVANAIGAVTSDVVVQKAMRISVAEQGGFIVEGVAGTKKIKDFQEADEFARAVLVEKVRDLGLAAGTSCRTVTLTFEDKIPKTASGDPIFMERIIRGTLTGRPDRVLAPAEGPAVKQGVPA